MYPEQSDLYSSCPWGQKKTKTYLVDNKDSCEGDGDKDGFTEEGSKEEEKVEGEGDGGGERAKKVKCKHSTALPKKGSLSDFINETTSNSIQM